MRTNPRQNCEQTPPKIANKQNYELLLKGPQTELRTNPRQNCEQTLQKLRTNRIMNKRAFLKHVQLFPKSNFHGVSQEKQHFWTFFPRVFFSLRSCRSSSVLFFDFPHGNIAGNLVGILQIKAQNGGESFGALFVRKSVAQ